MNTPKIDPPTAPGRRTARARAADETVPAHVLAAFAELDAAYTREAAGLTRRGAGLDLEWAGHCERLALICARRAGWWQVLFRATVRADLHTLHALAAVKARNSERDDARFWRETAADWQARAEHRPTSDAAGALSNWHELGVTA